MMTMPDDDSKTSVPSKATVTVETVASPEASATVLAAFESLVPLLVEPETLIQGLRYLQQRIPEFVQLSREEERAMMRVAHLDPEAIEIGIHAAEAWDETEDIVGWTGGKLRSQSNDARRWDGVERELDVLIRGVHGANLTRRHRLGTAILDLYNTLRRSTSRRGSRHAHLRPYVEEMKRVFRRVRNARSRDDEKKKT